MVHGLFAAAVELFGQEQYLISAAVLVLAADVHIVQHGVVLAFDLNFVDKLEEDAAVLLALFFRDLEVALDLVFLHGVGEFVFSQDLEDLALEHIFVLEFHFLRSVDFDLLVFEADLAVGELVSSAIHVHVEDRVLFSIRQVLSRVDQVH